MSLRNPSNINNCPKTEIYLPSHSIIFPLHCTYNDKRRGKLLATDIFCFVFLIKMTEWRWTPEEIILHRVYTLY